MHITILILTLVLLMTNKTYAQESTFPKHHTKNGFKNNFKHENHGFGDFLKWQKERFGKSVEAVTFELSENNPNFLKENKSEPTVTWVGHSTFLLQFEGMNILTDPHLTKRAPPVSFAGPKRHTKPGLTFENLPHIDFVVISHNHYDHLDKKTVKKLNEIQKENPPKFFVPIKVKEWFLNQGIENVEELDWWEKSEFANWEIHSVPVQHFSGRTLWDRNETLWCGWVLVKNDKRFFFAGDTGYSKDFEEIGEKFGEMDFSMIPIGAYEPRWFMKSMHINPDEAVQIHLDVKSKKSVGMHWGTFILTDEPMKAPPKDLEIAKQKFQVATEDFVVMKHGETKVLEFLKEPKLSETISE